MADNTFHEMFPLGEDTTEYRKLTSDFVSTTEFDGEEFLVVDPEGIKILTAEAFGDIAHYLRPGHLQQLSNILADDEASASFFRRSQSRVSMTHASVLARP